MGWLLSQGLHVLHWLEHSECSSEPVGLCWGTTHCRNSKKVHCPLLHIYKTRATVKFGKLTNKCTILHVFLHCQYGHHISVFASKPVYRRIWTNRWPPLFLVPTQFFSFRVTQNIITSHSHGTIHLPNVKNWKPISIHLTETVVQLIMNNTFAVEANCPVLPKMIQCHGAISGRASYEF